MTQQMNRTCWWCHAKLMKISHAEVPTPDGIVWTHKCCESATRAHFRMITAAPREVVTACDIRQTEWRP